MARPFDFADLLVGFSINQLSQLFDLDRRTVTERLRNIAPSGRRSQHPVYKLKDAAPLLIDGYLYQGEVDHKAKLQRADKEKDYWQAQLHKQKFLENNGDLWRTDKTIEILAGVFKNIRETVTVFVDRLEHESDLPPKQVEQVKRFGDNLLSETRDQLLAMDTGDDDQPGIEFNDSPFDHTPAATADTANENDLAELGLI